MIRVFMDDGEAGALRKSPDVRQLLLDGNVTLAGGGIAGIGDCRARGAGWNGILFHGVTLIEMEIREFLPNVRREIGRMTEIEIEAFLKDDIEGVNHCI